MGCGRGESPLECGAARPSPYWSEPFKLIANWVERERESGLFNSPPPPFQLTLPGGNEGGEGRDDEEIRDLHM